MNVCGNATIHGDLTVDGRIINPCLDLQIFTPAPSTDEVYDQFLLLSEFDGPKVAEDLAMQYVADAEHEPAPRLPGVFGYLSDGTLSLNGGELYNEHVTSVLFRVHGPDDSQVIDLPPQVILEQTKAVSDYMTERGMQIPPPDTFDSNKFQFNFRSSTTQNPIPSWIINFYFHFADGSNGENGGIPDAVDFIGMSEKPFPEFPDFASFSAPKGVAPYEADPEQRLDRFLYPLRVPLTSDCVEFGKRERCNKSAAFYNDITKQITISVRDIDFLSFRSTQWPLNFPPVQFTTLEYRMQGFQGKFQLTKRDRNNQLVVASFADASYLLQVSATVDVACTEFWGARDPQLQDLSFSVPYNTNMGVYSGIVASRINGGTPALDIYDVSPGFYNANVNAVDPMLTLSCHCGGGTQEYEMGDNPNTTTVEKLSAPSRMYWFDTDEWDQFDVQLTKEFFDTPPMPEQVALFPRVTPTIIANVIANTQAHEYVHNMQLGQGVIGNIDAESQAVGMEFDTAINQGDYYTGRGSAQARFVAFSTRGLWALLESESDNQWRGQGVYFGTYGHGMFWYWLKQRYDPLYQAMRRSRDIMATTWQTFQAQIEKLPQNLVFYGGTNRLSVKQALQELNGLDLSLVYRDFAIVLSLLRNNGSIPAQWRTYFPLWMAQRAYPDARKVSAISSSAVQFWWEEFDKNINPSPASLNVSNPLIAPGGRYPTFMLQLAGPSVVEMTVQDLSSNIFVVNRETVSTVKVNNTKGRIVVTMHLFISNIPDVNGTFIVQGPFELAEGGDHTFRVADFVGAGLLRLVVSNISITDFGGINNVIIDPSIDRITGIATITAA